MIAGRFGLVGLALLGWLVAVGAAEGASSLPGGASSLREVYDDWVLNCALAGGTPASVTCAISQEQFDKSTNRRIVAIGLNPAAEGGIKGTLIMPFGLALESGVTLQIDNGPQTSPLKFRTCTPAGCLIGLTWTSATVGALRAGGALKVSATSDNGKPVSFSVSLKGFAGGLDRAVDLVK